ncbi:MAG: hypothetical protein ACRD0U_11150 [Acidimicrobiales bacterium]
MTTRTICVTEDEAFSIAWAILEAVDRAADGDALADVMFFWETYRMIRRRIDEDRPRD